MRKFPEWIRRKLPEGSSERTTRKISELKLNTVCESAFCPNRSECWSKQTATFMILGKTCTRFCKFCGVLQGFPEMVQEDEPERVAQGAFALGFRHVVVTSVTRDDLQDEGANQFCRTIAAIRNLLPHVTIEILTPDFHARYELIRQICDARPAVFNHNLETVRRLTRDMRPQADYDRSLEVLRLVKVCRPEILTKSGIMVGLGETREEILQTMKDLRSVDCDILTIGQYLRPREDRQTVVCFVEPEVFLELRGEGKRMGFREVSAGPYVRSSYHAQDVCESAQVPVP
ncbi:MAG: lipoyl synthase [Omnitrophica bacterium RIFCSPLOWO2_12_FULL_44_17]|uniref:Lipoyl synthase n=1 Tax=Candidatus Danuiimicrobium aquiferis TaxID=1801832 RepID=A0A1G1KSR5_9BACT|nr:MAG: lipoyl synthase [Omnitrophica bacterium RIFCSPHIGHO2_02_FULL_45_28]OGW88806.1 MAG: lipoyl synthase [Omnitrophica bacterium RIFCSPHIGHO2_12_FULL_44_12]OGW96014.1 MAG: lipoyl synthase [Omnitrophica bacterium RIFCSPLOWO2_12_FULL_44_17]OGX03068.1 MAG: lipoyl synthase [Omnitrophica bacterium RIFCSPLOWO2_02_FULL_44_11]